MANLFNLNTAINEAGAPVSNLDETSIAANLDKDKDDFVNLIIEYLGNEDVMKCILIEIAYQGFDPAFIRAQMRARQPDQEKRKKQVGFLVLLMLSRGSSCIGRTGKVKPETADYISKLVEIYSIKRNVDPSVSNRDCVTLPRILNSYPEVALAVLSKYPQVNRPVSKEQMIHLGYDDFLSKLRGSFVFSCLPMSVSTADRDKHEATIKALLAYQVEESIILRKNKREKVDKPQILSANLVYALAAHSSQIVSNNLRESYDYGLQMATAQKWIATFNNTYPSYTDVHKQFV
ncbi:putative nucleoprotein [Hubei diptera virus 3]|uniref:Nucleoprotein n=1 Tax=Hubei diptera virus 3 TaxID=1922884 RepID=A0A1L3KPI3_9VIRU|nr:putative nucleoprotein [Hubei diptera virus 3]APG79287.1 putative nucleoprotein [Hubei diptera virus 3]